MSAPERNSVLIVTNMAIESSVLAQITRDLMVLNAEFGVSVYDPEGLVPDSLLRTLGVERSNAAPVLQLVYRMGETWPTYDPDLQSVLRDLTPDPVDVNIDGRGQVGYYLKPQGRFGPNRTELMLNRAYPRGFGGGSMVTLLWG